MTMAILVLTPLRCFEVVCALLIIYSLYSMDILAVASVAVSLLQPFVPDLERIRADYSYVL